MSKITIKAGISEAGAQKLIRCLFDRYGISAVLHYRDQLIAAVQAARDGHCDVTVEIPFPPPIPLSMSGVMDVTLDRPFPPDMFPKDPNRN